MMIIIYGRVAVRSQFFLLGITPFWLQLKGSNLTHHSGSRFPIRLQISSLAPHPFKIVIRIEHVNRPVAMELNIYMYNDTLDGIALIK